MDPLFLHRLFVDLSVGTVHVESMKQSPDSVVISTLGASNTAHTYTNMVKLSLLM